MPAHFPILWLTGNSGAGKTTLAKGAQRHFNERDTHAEVHRRIIVLDGDEMRASISTKEGLSPEDRRAHNLRVARLAKVLQDQGFLVIISVIAPFASVREEIDEICQPKWIYVKRSGLAAADRPYEVPLEPDSVIVTDGLSPQEGIALFLTYVQEETRMKVFPVGMAV